MTGFVADTHALIWYLEDDPRLGADASSAFDACDREETTIYVPTICIVEFVYLQEKGRIHGDLKSRLDDELSSGGTGLCLASLTSDVADSVARVPRSEVPDMPDRIIAATAVSLGLTPINKDRKIQLSGEKTIW